MTATQVIEQLSFEGIDVTGLRASLGSLTFDVWRRLAIGDRLAVRGRVVVVGVNHFRDDANMLVRNHKLKVDEAGLDKSLPYEIEDTALHFEGSEVGGFTATCGAVQLVPRHALKIGNRLEFVADALVAGVNFIRDEADVLIRNHKLKVIEADFTS